MRPRGRVLRIGETLDRYRIEALIGQGGMAAVYRARHLQLGSDHAIKVLFVTAPQLRERMFREGQVQARLRHPNIVQVTDVLLVQGTPALVMEYVDGPALDAWLQENRPTLDEALWLFRGILRGVAAAHEGEVVHRDLKPANVLLAPTHEGLVPKVTDFGLVKSISEQARASSGRAATQSGMALGTPEYMAPEQIRDASEVDQRADLWALGCILYELVCHRRAFSGPDKMSIFNAIVAGQYEPPRRFVDDLPRNVSEAIRALLVVDPDQRLTSCQNVYDLLYEEQAPKVGRLHVPARPSQRLLAESPASEITIPPDDTHSMLPSATPAAQANVPTGAPAARRVAGPSALRAGGPARIVTQDSEPRMRRITWLLPVLLLVIGLLGVVLTGLLLFPDDPGGPAPAPAPVQVPPDPLAPASPQPTPPPGPVVQPPPPTEPDPAPEPVPEPAPGPRPDRPRPTPTPPGPTPTPTPLPSGPLATFRLEGDAKSAWLESGGKRFGPGEMVAIGKYDIIADFGAGELKAGAVTLSSGETALVRCSGLFRQCRRP
jgi:serine/threonine protein kinase